MGRILHATSMIGISALAYLASGCVGQVSIRPDEEVTTGNALGFDFIDYTAAQQVAGYRTQPLVERLEIESDGRVVFTVYGAIDESPGFGIRFEAIRFLADAELEAIRADFNRSDFFTVDEDVYGEVVDRQLVQALVYQVDGELRQLRRYDRAELPPKIGVLFEDIETIAEMSQEFDSGDPVSVLPLVAGQTSRIDRRQFLVVKDRDALLDLLWRMGSIEVSVLPNIDFDREMLVCAFLGRDPTQLTGPERRERVTANIEFDGAAFTRDGILKVRYVRSNFPDGCSSAVRPFALARVPRSDLSVEFWESSDPGSDVPCRP